MDPLDIQRLINVPIARIILPRPLLELVPAPALPYLAHASPGNHTLGRVAWSVVGVADDILPQRIGAVDHMTPGPRLRQPLPELHKRDVERSLCINQYCCFSAHNSPMIESDG